MHCPFCSFEDTKVIDSRLAGEGRQVRRRRECLSCGERFTTFEQPELVMPYVVKRDDRREPFDEGKLRSGILAALQKRPVQREDIERSIEHVTHSLQTMGEREVPSRLIGDLVMEELRRLFEERLAEQNERHDGGNRWIGTGGTSPFGNGGFHPSGLRVGASEMGTVVAVTAVIRAGPSR